VDQLIVGGGIANTFIAAEGHFVGKSLYEKDLVDTAKKLIADATSVGFSGLKGHRSVGGIRASIYNAFPKKGVEDLVTFMNDFKKKN
jgi:phosphoserine aminotransferase